jgi:hypothetical protein
MKTFGGMVEVELHAFSTLPLRGGDLLHPFVASPLAETAPCGRQGRSECYREDNQLNLPGIEP